MDMDAKGTQRSLDLASLRDSIAKKKTNFSKALNEKFKSNETSTLDRISNSTITREMKRTQYSTKDTNTEDLLNSIGLISKRKEGR